MTALETAITNLDGAVLDEVARARARRLSDAVPEAQPVETPRTRWLVSAGVLAACLALLALAAVRGVLPLPALLPGASGSRTEAPTASSAAPAETPPATSGAPDFTPAYRSPTLEELYDSEPYASLLPQELPAACRFSSSYLAVYDSFANPEGKHYLEVNFDVGSGGALRIRVAEYDGKQADSDPPYDRERIFPIAVEIIGSSRREGAASWNFHCGDYTVCYSYSWGGITADELCDMILSSKWMRENALETA